MNLSISKIEKHGMYGYTKKLEENGIGLVVLETGEQISGMRLLMNGNQNFTMSKDAFFSLMDTGNIKFIETLPRFVIKDIRKGFANNLKNHNDPCIV